MNKLEKAKEIIRENIADARCGLFDSRNNVGDRMDNLYYDTDEGLIIDICYGWAYFEVFGLSYEDFDELHKYYDSLINHYKGGTSR